MICMNSCRSSKMTNLKVIPISLMRMVSLSQENQQYNLLVFILNALEDCPLKTEKTEYWSAAAIMVQTNTDGRN